MRNRRSWIWISLGLFSVLLRLVLSPAQLEQIYSRGLFLYVRRVFDTGLTGWLPFPLLYLFVPVVLAYFGWRIVRFVRLPGTRREKLRPGLLGVGAFFGGIIFFFLFLWGYNYGRQPVEERLGLNPVKISVDSLGLLMRQEMREVARLRAAIPGADTSALADEVFPANLEAVLRPLVEQTLHEYGYPTTGRVRGRVLRPNGALLRFSTAGIYFPFTAEGHVDGGLLPLQQVYTMGHELAHGYGFGDEGTCSFWSYLACGRSDDPAIAYAGRLGYWRTLAGTFLLLRPDEYTVFRDSLPPGIRADLNAINENLDKYPDILPWLRYAAYDAYLKAQGIEEGMLNYNRVILLVEAWRRKGERERWRTGEGGTGGPADKGQGTGD